MNCVQKKSLFTFLKGQEVEAEDRSLLRCLAAAKFVITPDYNIIEKGFLFVRH